MTAQHSSTATCAKYSKLRLNELGHIVSKGSVDIANRVLIMCWFVSIYMTSISHLCFQASSSKSSKCSGGIYVIPLQCI